MIWQHMTSQALGRMQRQTPVIFPVAAVEQHGGHLPLGTDRLIAEWFCTELDKEMADQVLILPAVPVGCSQHHMDFPGSLTLRHETFGALVEEVLESVSHHGFHNLVVFNSHGGNQGIGQVIVERWGARHPNCRTVFASWWRIAAQHLLWLNESGPGGVGHACEFETSLMDVIAPELIDRPAIASGENVATYSWAEGDMLRAPAASFYRSMKQMTSNGVYGRPEKASRRKGVAIREVVVTALRQIVQELFDSSAAG